MTDSSGVVLFHTSSSALRAEKTCLKSGLEVKLVPTPREMSSDCGMALAFPWRLVEQLEQLLGAARVETAGIHLWQAYTWRNRI
jgi:hypothetical protein